jgi:DNA-binding transcriptional regulator of glucitol operon
MTVVAQSPKPEESTSAPTAGNQRLASTASSNQNWTRIYIKDPSVRDAVRRALQTASVALQTSKCQALLTEFSDQHGRALTERLTELKMNVGEYLTFLVVEDGETDARCGEQGVLAFTIVGSRVIRVCGRAFARVAERDAEEAQATIVHELLHTLGLGENPPSPHQITYWVKKRCW